ncbi:hypothetical protein [Chryseosolibacter indicus]|uniref:STAS domain-containing protein n=1 Tax=Chryseosolibacter indicus TaxID=2782351 RepID=A0ABS5VW12_9BACT|nr:hypothetical protein [Chryseosolibacter indicus]MBT1705059.1 hypothetical protein [Chryseosolibacter indicus]
MKPIVTIEKENNNITKVMLSGDLTVKYHKDIAEAFQKLSAESTTSIVVDNPSAIDLCFLQVLWSYKKYHKMRGQNISISFTLGDAEYSLLLRTGFQTLLEQA